MFGVRKLVARLLTRPRRRAKAGSTVTLRVEGLEDRVTPVTAAGHWQGTLEQPGGPWEDYNLSYELTQSGTSVTGTERIEVAGQPLYFAEFSVSGTATDTHVVLNDGGVSSQNLPPGYGWLRKAVTFPLPPEVPSETVDGTWSAGFLHGGTVHLEHTSAPQAPVANPSLRIFEGDPDQTPFQQQTFRITTADTLAVRIPSLTFVLRDLPTGVVPSLLPVTWTTTVRYTPGAGSPPGAKEVPGFSFTVTRLGVEYRPIWPSIRGGDLDVTARFTFGGRTYTVSSEAVADTRGIRILGSNPTKAQIQSLIGGYRPPADWPQKSGYDYHSVLRRIVSHETNLTSMGAGGYNQFYRTGQFAGHPTWNTGGDGGVGLMQVTTKPIVAANLWDWRANIAAGVAVLNDKLRVAATYPQTIQSFSSFKTAVALFNQDRAALGLRPLVRVEVQAWTPAQRVLVAIRAYNGAAGTDSIGTRILNEFELATRGTGSNRRLALQVNELSLVGVARWVRVPIDRRTAGEPDYVNLVLNAPDM